MTKLKEVDSKSESESDRRQQTQKAKIPEAFRISFLDRFDDVVEDFLRNLRKDLGLLGLLV
jgi:hypothetical protein